MGDARDLVRGSRGAADPDSIIGKLEEVLDDIDSALQIKEQDLFGEPGAEPQNHYKLGLLKGADSLIRRAQAMLEDYDTFIAEDFEEAEEDAS